MAKQQKAVQEKAIKNHEGKKAGETRKEKREEAS